MIHNSPSVAVQIYLLHVYSIAVVSQLLGNLDSCVVTWQNGHVENLEYNIQKIRHVPNIILLHHIEIHVLNFATKWFPQKQWCWLIQRYLIYFGSESIINLASWQMNSGDHTVQFQCTTVHYIIYAYSKTLKYITIMHILFQTIAKPFTSISCNKVAIKWT